MCTSKDQADQERTRDVNDERSVREPNSRFPADVTAQPEAQNRPQTASNANHHVFEQVVLSLSGLPSSSSGDCIGP